MKAVTLAALGLVVFSSPSLAGAKFITVDIGGVFTIVTGLNQSSVVTGSYDEPDFSAHGFLRTPDGTVTKFDAVAGTRRTVPTGINDDNAVTGNYTDPDTSFARGFMRDRAGNVVTFDAFGGTGQTFPSAINNKGEVTGFYIDGSGNTFGFVRSPKGKIKGFTINEAGAEPKAINKNGLITGIVYGQQEAGFLRSRDNTVTTFTAAANSNGTESVAIND